MAAITASVAVAAGSAYMSKRAADKQTKEMRRGRDAATEEQRRQYDQTREDFAPWRTAGVDALNKLADPMKYFYESPDYQFRRSEGLRDIGNLFAARGGGGNAMKALTQYSSNLASGEFGNWFNRQFGISEAGRGAQGTVAHAGSNAANQIGGYAMNAARGIGQAYADRNANISNAMNQGISNILFAREAGI